MAAALRILQPEVRECLSEWNKDCSQVIRVYLRVGHNMLRAYTDENITVKERSKLAWSAVCFVRLWKSWLEMSSYPIESSFTSLQTYNDVVLAGHSLILSIKVFSEHFPDQSFNPSTFGSDSCESNISKTSASVSSGFPNMRPSAFIVFECLETPMKHEPRVFEIASLTCIMNQEQ